MQVEEKRIKEGKKVNRVRDRKEKEKGKRISRSLGVSEKSEKSTQRGKGQTVFTYFVCEREKEREKSSG